MLAALPFFAGAGLARAQTVPISGNYPGGHVGIRGGATPAPKSLGYSNFNRISYAYSLKGDSGQTIQGPKDAELFYSNISLIIWVTPLELLGGHLGGFVALPFTDVTNRASDLTVSADFGFGDAIFFPWLVFAKAGEFDYQWGVGFVAPTGSFTEGGTDNHGSGFWELMWSLGGVWHPKGERERWSLSAVLRIENNFKQRQTDINVGDDMVIDFGAGYMFHTGKKTEHLLDTGISGFATWQVQKQTGPDPSDYANRYRVLALGPELKWIVPKWKLHTILRAHAEFAAKNTT